jgi:hypothetical protein
MPRRHASLVPLSRDHHDALALAFRLHHPSPPGPATAVTPPSTPASRAREVLEFYTAHLAGHFRAEEEVLFPAIAHRVAAGSSAAALVRELVEEHGQMAALREDIGAALERSADAGEDVLLAPLGELADVLERHVRREERELFVAFAELVAEPDASALGPRMDAILAARQAV